LFAIMVPAVPAPSTSSCLATMSLLHVTNVVVRVSR
jgi:hypothetical protein